MKIAVFSDTHKHIGDAARVIDREQPDLVIHLGDHIRDAYALAGQFPHTPMECVPGNCDYAPAEPETKLLTLCGVRVMITHGHNYRVKYEMDSLLNAAYFQGADMVLFGHTHRPVNDRVEGLYVVNPGTAGMGSSPTWALIELEPGKVKNVSILKV
ncbi:MAG: YfcE family phosphodiesterase [Oscillospiraceae bacterium]|nr:YfcE family phosphodiesterase [Oscillospiraceae bacterium]MDD6502490.1 YfcE family phosphodiesterase [Oscillospiraceae bacterium]MDY4104662.1 YfcE family phosphodiesterase [Oscillospiraceae bacterium]